MQDRYVGDIGDFVKIALLRALSPGRSLGVAWFLTPDEQHNGDGRHIAYLSRPDSWRPLDPSVFDGLHALINRGTRSIDELEHLLPEARFHRRRLVEPQSRPGWFEELDTSLSDCDFLFLDPDNGLEPAGYRAGRAKSIKSVTYDEVARLLRPGRALVIYHHQTRMPGGHDQEIQTLAQRLRQIGASSVVALRAKPYSPRVFFIVNGDPAMIERARQFAHKWQGLVTLHEDQGPPSAAASNTAQVGSCPFCTLDQSRMVATNKHGMVLRDLYPVSEGHTLVIPRRHIASWFDASDEEQAALMQLLRNARNELSERFAPAGFNIGINDGAAAGQTVPHLHVHLIPRYEGDMPDPRGGVRWVLPQHADYWSKL